MVAEKKKEVEKKKPEVKEEVVDPKRVDNLWTELKSLFDEVLATRNKLSEKEVALNKITEKQNDIQKIQTEKFKQIDEREKAVKVVEDVVKYRLDTENRSAKVTIEERRFQEKEKAFDIEIKKKRDIVAADLKKNEDQMSRNKKESEALQAYRKELDLNKATMSNKILNDLTK